MKKSAMVILWAMTLAAGCRCGDDPCDRDERGRDERRWGRHHDRDRDRDDEAERCEEDGGAGGGASDAGAATPGDAAATTPGDAATTTPGDAASPPGDASVGADSCVHPAP